MRIELLGNDYIDIPNDTSVGVGFSGGVDSTLLLYIMLLYSPHTVFPLTITVNNRYHRHKQVASEVLELCCNETGNNEVIHSAIHCNDIDLENGTNPTALKQNWFLKSGMISTLFLGTNQLPPAGHIHTEDFRHNHTDEYYRREPGVLKATSTHGGAFQLPLINYDKRQICELYRKFGISDEIYKRTWSCSTILSDKDWNVNRHCGKCGPCHERIFGFGKIE